MWSGKKRMRTMKHLANNLADYLDGVQTVAIAGHQNPDGDCIGSCMGTYLYLKANFPQIQTDVYLESWRATFAFIEDLDKAQENCDPARIYDLLILLDISSRDRIGVAGVYVDTAKQVLVFDHHVTNDGEYTWKWNDPDASSASEVVCRFMEMDKITKSCAEALYTGIVHDTGVFQYSCTSPATMRMAAALMEKGLDHSRIIDESYYQKSWAQNRILGVALEKSRLHLDGRCISAVITQKEMKELGLTKKDMDGIVSQLRNTIGVEVSIFLYQGDKGGYKISLRSKDKVDVAAICQSFGGGGHKKAAGAFSFHSEEGILNRILEQVEVQLREQSEPACT